MEDIIHKTKQKSRMPPPKPTLLGLENLRASNHDPMDTTREKKRSRTHETPAILHLEKHGDPDSSVTSPLKKQKMQTPELDTYKKLFGADSTAQLYLKLDEYFADGRKQQLKIADVQSLILWILVPEAYSPKWVFIKNKPLVNKVVFVMVDLLSHDVVAKNTRSFPKLAEIFDRAISVMIPSSFFKSTSVLQYYLNCTKKIRGFNKLSRNKKKHRHSKSPPSSRYPTYEPSNRKGSHEDVEPMNPPIAHYLLSENERNDNGYPCSGKPDFDDYVTMDPRTTPKEGVHIIAVDCEMVVTKANLELARCTLVDETGAVVYDEFVKPENKILDYSTKWSGITPELLENVTTTLKDVQKHLARIIDRDTVIVGHSLENDFMALKIIHKRAIDTALLFPHPQGPPFKSALKFLTNKYLQRSIQDSHSGHDSAEDARAALELAQLKFKYGPSFGVNPTSGENLFNILNRYRIKTKMLSPASVLKTYAPSSVSVVVTSSDEETVRKSKEALKGPEAFSFLALKGPGLRAEPKLDHYAKMDDDIAAIYNNVPQNSLFVVVTGQGISYEAKCLQEQKMNCILGKKRHEWTTELQTQLDRAMSSTQNGLSFFAIK